MAKQVMEASQAVAEAVKLCKPSVVAMYPITPQTHIVERIADFVNDGIMDTEMIDVESEHSAVSACIGAQATGVRTFTATASQGLALMHEMLFIASGMRLPIVMAVANRALSAPINIWCFSKDAEVLMSDLSYRPINKVKVGERILGKDKKGNLVFAEVKRTYKREVNDILKLRTEKFDLVCTPEHRFYYHPSHFHWVQAKYLRDKKLHFFGYGFKENREFKRGWLSGMADGDGCFFKDKQNRIRFTLKLKDEEIIKTFVKWAAGAGFYIREADYHKKRGFFTAILTKNREARRFRKFLEKNRSQDFLRGYLAGLYDAEGSGPFKVKQAIIYNSNRAIVDFTIEALRELKISFKLYSDDRKGSHYKRCNYHIKINNVPEFFVKCRPILGRKRNNLLRMTLKSVKSRLKVLDVTNLKKKTQVHNLETETNNYIVNGFLVHNCDHQDSIAERDAGWIQLYVESSQEALDTVIQAYKIAEDKDVLLPVMVCLDGFTLSHVWEPADIPTKAKVNQFLPKYRPIYAFLDPRKPITQGPVGFPNSFMEFRKMQQDAAKTALKIIQKTNSEFRRKFRRSYGNGLIDTYKLAGAQYAVVAMGSVCGTARHVIDRMRKQGKRVGLIKVRSFRPFPVEDLAKAAKNLKGIAVIDKDISIGHEGALFSELKSALWGKKTRISGFIAGLGGRDITPENVESAVDHAIKGKETREEWLLK